MSEEALIAVNSLEILNRLSFKTVPCERNRLPAFITINIKTNVKDDI